MSVPTYILDILAAQQRDLGLQRAELAALGADFSRRKTERNRLGNRNADLGRYWRPASELPGEPTSAIVALLADDGEAWILSPTLWHFMPRLRYRVRDGKLAFWFELIRHDKVLEAATQTVIGKIKLTGNPFFFGEPFVG